VTRFDRVPIGIRRASIERAPERVTPHPIDDVGQRLVVERTVRRRRRGIRGFCFGAHPSALFF